MSRKNSKAVGLTTQQLATFERDGLLVVEDFLNLEEVTELRAEIEKLVDEMDPVKDRGVFSTTNYQQVCLLGY